ncbi:CIA30 family protein [Pseudohongiella spirulinae]|uniref:NADH:ubiquinone oxidoreductase intermediate-associated protein 30 domain-containing protein n=1 Tax=Pseudohongiella spirulinae TaxID=1249552 RepID=A0A0S2KB90_9GAMM|nr:CIA30 family protein [Pseudohongiella spirulinae]ALO45595.1 hypothetical protein PS2015_925 [Pseudohongiella spirulinae]
MNTNTSETKTLIDFSDPADVAPWHAINDGVMGGRSSSAPQIANGCLRFSGSISLENNGGFASIRSQQRLDLSHASGVLLRVLGDGRRYQFRLYTDADYQGSKVAYSVSFDTLSKRWLELPLAFKELKPVFRGRTLSGPTFNPAAVEQIGFLLADKCEGPFHLSVAWVKAM